MRANLPDIILHVIYQHRFGATVSNHDFINMISEWMKTWLVGHVCIGVPVQSSRMIQKRCTQVLRK